MEHIRGTQFTKQNTCVAFGSFDGVHLGHAAIAARMKDWPGLTSVAVSLETEGQKIVNTEEEKARLLGQLGVEVMISYPASAYTDDKAFIRDVVVGQLGAKVVVAGAGAEALPALKELAPELGYELAVVDTVLLNGKAVSCQAIVEAFADGDFDGAIALMGHPHLIIGVVEHGKGQGHLYGNPTANVGQHKDKYFVPHGVYAVISYIGEEEELTHGMCNIGLRPSDDDIPIPTIEENIFDFDRDIYDQRFVMEVHLFVRPVMKFPSLKEVREQVLKDKDRIHEYLDDMVAQARAKAAQK